MNNQHEIAARAAKLFKQRDVIAERLRLLDKEIEAETHAYAKAVGLFGFTTWMMRRACEARGMLVDRNAA